MTLLIAIILGLVQGLCEFLPVSSSGHLVLLQNVFGVTENSLFFAIMLHFGTLIAVVVVYRESLWGIIRAFFKLIGLLFSGKKEELKAHTASEDVWKLWLLIIATAITTAMALAFGDLIEESYQGTYLGFGFLITAIALFLMNFVGQGKHTIGETKWYKAAGIGLMQGIAILPGISRSGCTIASASYMGLKKEAAAEFGCFYGACQNHQHEDCLQHPFRSHVGG